MKLILCVYGGGILFMPPPYRTSKWHKHLKFAYYIFEETDDRSYNSIVWMRDGFSFEVLSEVSIDELLEIAKSVNR